jgi:hypothetical protein
VLSVDREFKLIKSRHTSVTSPKSRVTPPITSALNADLNALLRPSHLLISVLDLISTLMVGRNKDKAGARERMCSGEGKESMRRSTKTRKPERGSKKGAAEDEAMMGPALAKLEKEEPPPAGEEAPEEEEAEDQEDLSKRFDRGKMQVEPGPSLRAVFSCVRGLSHLLC